MSNLIDRIKKRREIYKAFGDSAGLVDQLVIHTEGINEEIGRLRDQVVVVEELNEHLKCEAEKLREQLKIAREALEYIKGVEDDDALDDCDRTRECILWAEDALAKLKEME